MTTRPTRNARTAGSSLTSQRSQTSLLSRPGHEAQAEQPEQLSLLRTSDLPVQFRLDRRTRERGLEHVAAIRQLLAAKHAGTEVATTNATPHDQAA